MIVQTKAIAFFIFIPLLLGAQGNRSCRRSSPANTATPAANRSSDSNAGQKSQSNGNRSAPANASSAANQDKNQNKNMSNPSKEGKDGAPEGVWGGAHVRLSAREGGADIEFDCAHGEISAPLVTDAEGRFDLPGTFVREGPGPIRVGRAPAARPARYSGRVEGRTMMLTLKFTDTDQAVDTFTLTRGSEGRLWKCR